MRMAAICLGILAAAVLMTGCHGTETVEKSVILTGKVTEADTSIALAGVKVYETSHAGLSTVTDSLGIFKLDGVAFEEHNIYFEKDGYKPETLWFEYTGLLTRPLLSQSMVMTKSQ